MNLHQPYSHQPVEWISEFGERECQRCPRPLAPVGAGLRHADEAFHPVRLSTTEAAAVRITMDVIERALADMPTDRCSDRDRAYVAAKALHQRGLIAAKTRRRRTSSAV